MHTLIYREDLISKLDNANRRSFEALRKIGQDLMILLAGFRPKEGDDLGGEVWLRKSNVLTFAANTDYAADSQLILFTNVAPAETISFSALTQPTGTGYGPIALTDANWTGTTSPFAYALQTFTAGAGGWTGNIQGYAVISNKAGTGVQRIWNLEVDANGPYTLAENAKYNITPNVNFN